MTKRTKYMIKLMFTVGLIVSNAVLFVLFSRQRYTFKKKKKEVEMYSDYYDLCKQWVNNLHRGEHASQYIEQKNYKRVVIYGMGEIGKRLCEELQMSESDISLCFSDSSSQYSYTRQVELIKPTEISSYNPDVVVVTVPYAFDVIKQFLISDCNLLCDIISVEDIIYHEYIG